MSAPLNTGDLAVRVERDPETGAITVRLSDRWGWTWQGTLADAVVDGRRGWSGTAQLGETLEAYRMPGETASRERAVADSGGSAPAAGAALHTGVTLPDVRAPRHGRAS